MDRFEFLERIDELNIDSSAFWLNGPSNERYCLGEYSMPKDAIKN